MTTMTDSDTKENKPQDYLLIVHDRVPGRTRINVTQSVSQRASAREPGIEINGF